MRPPVSIVIVYHAGLGYLQACLDSVLADVAPDDEIIVIANNRHAHELDLPSFHSRIRIVKFAESLGYAGASNAGAALASRNHLVFCDHDLVFLPGWLDQLWRSYSAVPNAGACSCQAINPHSLDILDFGIAFSPFNGAHPGLDLPPSHPLVAEDRIAQAVCTSGLLIGAADFDAAGKFDVSFGSMYTDLDLCLKLKRLGRPVIASARARALHFGGDVHMAGDKAYKTSAIKADVKGAFMRKHADILEVDLDFYFGQAISHHIDKHGPFQHYVCCNLMNVADPQWYEQQLAAGGLETDGVSRLPSGRRDALNIGLFEQLGFDLMLSNNRIAYFVDRLSSVRGNEYWWSRRAGKHDLIIDRNANILPAATVLSRQRQVGTADGER